MEPAGTGAAPAARHSRGRPRVSVASVVWAASPLFTLGFGTWAAFLYGAIRRRSWWLGGASAVYALLAAAWLAASAPAHPGPLGYGIAGLFVSADELSLALGLPPDSVPALAELTVYPA